MEEKSIGDGGGEGDGRRGRRRWEEGENYSRVEEGESEMGGGGEGDGSRRRRRWEEGEKEMGGKKERWMRTVENREEESIGDGGEECREEGGE